MKYWEIFAFQDAAGILHWNINDGYFFSIVATTTFEQGHVLGLICYWNVEVSQIIDLIQMF